MDIVANTFLHCMAAFETVSTTLSFCLYELALNENVQEKLLAEVQRVKDQYVEFNCNALTELPYLDAVIAGELYSPIM